MVGGQVSGICSGAWIARLDDVRHGAPNLRVGLDLCPDQGWSGYENRMVGIASLLDSAPSTVSEGTARGSNT